MNAPDALDKCDEILDLIEELPEKAEEYAASVTETVVSIKTQVEQRNHITPGQATALENIEAGINRWLR